MAFGVNREMTDWASAYGYVSHEPKYNKASKRGDGWGQSKRKANGKNNRMKYEMERQASDTDGITVNLE